MKRFSPLAEATRQGLIGLVCLGLRSYRCRPILQLPNKMAGFRLNVMPFRVPRVPFDHLLFGLMLHVLVYNLTRVIASWFASLTTW